MRATMCVCIHVCVYVSKSEYGRGACLRTCGRVRASLLACTHAFMRACMHAGMHAVVHAYVPSYMRVCIRASVCACISVNKGMRDIFTCVHAHLCVSLPLSTCVHVLYNRSY